MGPDVNNSVLIVHEDPRTLWKEIPLELFDSPIKAWPWLIFGKYPMVTDPPAQLRGAGVELDVLVVDVVEELEVVEEELEVVEELEVT